MHPEIDRYAHLESPIHSWDPALKITGLGIFIFGLAVLSHLFTALWGLAVALLLLRLSRISLRFVLQRLKPLILFMIPFFLILPITVVHSAETGPRLEWVWENERMAALLLVRAAGIAVTVFPMLGTAPFHLSMKSLQDLGIPRILIQAVLFTYRYLFVYLDQLRKMRIAMTSRGFRPRLNKRSFKVYGYQVGMLLVTSFEQTERILNAMKSRGYDGELRILYQPKRTAADWGKLAVVIGITFLLGMGDRLWVS